MILVYVEHDGDRPERSSLEAVTVGRSLAERLGVPLQAFLCGPGAADAGAGLGTYGVSRALVAEGARLTDYAPAAWGRSLAQAVEASGADLTILLCAGGFGSVTADGPLLRPFDVATVALHQPDDDLHQGALSGAIRAQQPKHS